MKNLLIALGITLLLAFLACGTTEPQLSSTELTPMASNLLVKVIRVIDGDTIEVGIGGSYYTVRYIGIDTPETKHPIQGVEYFGLEASEKNRQLVENKMVYLEKDISETDKYNRLLRYVFVGDVMVNAALVEGGYAEVSTYPPDVKYVELFLELQQEARESRRGLWNLDSMDVGQGTTSDCDTAYPTVCIPSPPPDLNCGDIQHRKFTVLAADPHRFDGDKDGIGCES